MRLANTRNIISAANDSNQRRSVNTVTRLKERWPLNRTWFPGRLWLLHNIITALRVLFPGIRLIDYNSDAHHSLVSRSWGCPLWWQLYTAWHISARTILKANGILEQVITSHSQ